MADNTRKSRHVYRSTNSDDWLVNHHRANLVRLVSHTTRGPLRRRRLLELELTTGLGGRTGFRVDFAELQRMKMRKLQIKLIRHAATMAKSGKEPATSKSRSTGKDPTTSKKSRSTGKAPANSVASDNSDGDSSNSNSDEATSETWEEDLENYVKTVRDYDYMVGFAGKANDPFVATSEHRVDHKILEDEMHNAGIDFGFLVKNVHSQYEHPEVDDSVLVLRTGRWSVTNSPIWGTRYLKPDKKYWRRLIALGVAYVFVLLPGILIVGTSLSADPGEATLTPFIILGSFVGAWAIFMIFFATEIKDVVTLTAGYTAVLGILLNGAAGLRKSRDETTVV